MPTYGESRNLWRDMSGFARICRKVLKWTAIAVAGLLLLAVVAVRFTDGAITNDGTVLLGFDERAGRFQFWEAKTYYLDGIDGPYLLNGELITVDAESRVHRRPFAGDTLLVPVSKTDSFLVSLPPSPVPQPWSWAAPSRLLAVSDIEGNFTGFTSLLRAQGVIGERHEWTFGDGHLLLLGDMLDRGEQVMPVLWLIYRLEQEAVRAGGRVHYILGNHEVMAMQGDCRYAIGKYKALARMLHPEDDLRSAYAKLFSAGTPLGAWLRTKHAVERIGGDLFVHGGISPALVAAGLSPAEISSLIRNHIDHKPGNTEVDSTLAALVMGSDGPLWFRRLAEANDHGPRISETELRSMLQSFGCTRAFIGHTVMPDITADLGGTLVLIDVHHGNEAASGLTRGVLIEAGQSFVVNDRGERRPL